MVNPSESTNQFASCPKCGQKSAERVSFTWWGGVLGPKMFTHVKCLSCGGKYNGKTGKENTVNIVLYTLIAGIGFFVVFFLFFFFIR